MERGVGQFVPAGVPLLLVSRRGPLDPMRAAELLGAFDIGPTRTLQQDVEFGVIQIVDIALRAISPAVNDPSTAISCIDQLSRILIRWLGRAPPESVLFDPPHVVRVVVPWIGLEGMLDTGVRANPPLRGERSGGQPAAAAGDRRYRRDAAAQRRPHSVLATRAPGGGRMRTRAGRGGDGAAAAAAGGTGRSAPGNCMTVRPPGTPSLGVPVRCVENPDR